MFKASIFILLIFSSSKSYSALPPHMYHSVRKCVELIQSSKNLDSIPGLEKVNMDGLVGRAQITSDKTQPKAVFRRTTVIPKHLIELMTAPLEPKLYFLENLLLEGKLQEWIDFIIRIQTVVVGNGKYGGRNIFPENQVEKAVFDGVALLDHFQVLMPEKQSQWIEKLPYGLAWKNNNSLNYHFEKHGVEVQAKTEKEYLEKANEFWRTPLGVSTERIAFQRNDGAFIFYDTFNFNFMVIKNNKIITFYPLSKEYRQPIDFDKYIVEDLLKK